MPHMPRPICLVTGGAGFIGSHLAQRLLELDYQVRIVDNFSTGKREHIKDFVAQTELFEGSILDEALLENAMTGVQFVFHQAAIRSVSKSVDNPYGSHETNVTGTLKVLLAAKKAGAERVIYASSSSLYGDNEKCPQKETMQAQPISPYAVSKLSGELYCRVFTKSFNLPTVSLRYFNVYGPRQDPESIYSAVIPRFMELAMEDKPLEVHWDGKQSRDFTYVGDVVNANICSLKAKPAVFGEAFNIAGGKNYSLLQLIALLERIIGRKLKKNFHPKRAADVRKTYADIAKAKRLLGYKPQTAFASGLAKTWGYFTANAPKLVGAVQ